MNLFSFILLGNKRSFLSLFLSDHCDDMWMELCLTMIFFFLV